MDNPINNFSEVKLGILKSVELVLLILMIAAISIFVIHAGVTVYSFFINNTDIFLIDILPFAFLALGFIVLNLIKQSVSQKISFIEQHDPKVTSS